jgi:hypothetical protein
MTDFQAATIVISEGVMVIGEFFESLKGVVAIIDPLAGVSDGEQPWRK